MKALLLLLAAAVLALAPQASAVPGIDAGYGVEPQDVQVPGFATPATCQVRPCDNPTTTPTVPVTSPGMPIEQVCVPADTLCIVEAGPFPGVPPVSEEVPGQTAPALCGVAAPACVGPIPVGPIPVVTTPAVDAGVHSDAFDPTVDPHLGESEQVGPFEYVIPPEVPVLGGGPVAVCKDYECERNVTPEAGAHTTVEVVLVVDGHDYGTSKDVGADVPSV